MNAIHGTKFYNPKHDAAGIVLDNEPSRNGYYTVYYPVKEMYRRYNATKLLELFNLNLYNPTYAEVATKQLDGIIGAKLIDGKIAVLHTTAAVTYEQAKQNGMQVNEPVEVAKQGVLITLYFEGRIYVD